MSDGIVVEGQDGVVGSPATAMSPKTASPSSDWADGFPLVAWTRPLRRGEHRRVVHDRSHVREDSALGISAAARVWRDKLVANASLLV